jgi:hypothetical protein
MPGGVGREWRKAPPYLIGNLGGVVSRVYQRGMESWYLIPFDWFSAVAFRFPIETHNCMGVPLIPLFLIPILGLPLLLSPLKLLMLIDTVTVKAGLSHHLSAGCPLE